jgi:hypothetical protein
LPREVKTEELVNAICVTGTVQYICDDFETARIVAEARGEEIRAYIRSFRAVWRVMPGAKAEPLTGTGRWPDLGNLC